MYVRNKLCMSVCLQCTYVCMYIQIHKRRCCPSSHPPAGRCPPLPLLSGTQPLHSPSAANTIAIYRCLPGHMFSDGTFRQVAQCNGIRWNNTDDVCNGNMLCVYNNNLKTLLGCSPSSSLDNEV